MSRQNFNAPKLPKQLRDKVEAGGSTGSKRRKALPRKEQRKLERQQKKQNRHEHGQSSHRVTRAQPEEDEQDEEIADPWADDESEEQRESTPPRKRVKLSPPVESTAKRLSEVSGREGAISRPRPSKAVRDALADDDAEIAFLEKKLGIRGKKRSKVADDGFEGLLAGIDDAVMGDDRARNEDLEWMSAKRQSQIHPKNGNRAEDEELSGYEDVIGSSVVDQNDDVDEDDDDEDQNDEIVEDPFGGSESESAQGMQRPVRENPYRAPVPTPAATQKYLPPSLRAPAKDDQEMLQRLKRQLQGLLNRLSEANILSIIKDVESVLANNARQHVISTVIDLLISLVADRSSHLDSFIVLHAGFIAGLYSLMGTHFGAELLERVVKEFRLYYNEQAAVRSGSKETSNLIALLAELYSFQVIAHHIVFDLIRLFVSDLSELNVELLLKLIRNCGSQLRTDDPLALKDIVLLVHQAVNRQGGEQQVSARTRFMIETITSLKNNRLRAGASNGGNAEHVQRIRHRLHPNGGRNIEPLGVSLKDIDNAAKGGKWWLVGASWTNDAGDRKVSESSGGNTVNADDATDGDPFGGEDTNVPDDLLLLARKHRMNTSVRQKVFITILTATDFRDAWLRIRQLRLSKSQQHEIPRILVHLVGAEDPYNPYYGMVARKLCAEQKYRKAFRFNLHMFCRRCGEMGRWEREDLPMPDGTTVEAVDLRELVSVARFYGELLASQSMAITDLKGLDFAQLQRKTQIFVEILLITVMETISKQNRGRPDDAGASVARIFATAQQAPQMVPGLQFFLKTKVRRSGLIADAESKKAVLYLCRLAASATNLAGNGVAEG